MSNVRKRHIEKNVREGAIYTENGRRYIGTFDKRLKIEDVLQGDITGTTLRTVVSKIGDYSTNELIDLIDDLKDRINTLEECIDCTEPPVIEPIDRCKLIAYNVMFDYPPIDDHCTITC